jgi:hypothetical protein
MRDQLLPLLGEMYGAGFSRNLTVLADESEQARQILLDAVLRPFWDTKVVTKDTCIVVECGSHLQHSTFFWKEALRYIFHDLMHTAMMRERPVGQLLDKLRRSQACPDTATKKGLRQRAGAFKGWFTIKKENRCYVDGSRMVLFRSHFFEPQDGPTTKWEGRPIELGQEYHFGKWTVSVQEVTEASSRSVAVGEGLDGKPPPLSLWDVVEGKFSYRIPTATSYVTGTRSGFKPLLGVEVVVAASLPIVRGIGDLGQVRGTGPQVEVCYLYAPEKEVR